MHEAGPVRAALAAVVGGWANDGKRDRHLELLILDATRVHADGVAFYAQALLADRGLAEVTFDVRVEPVTCALCGRSGVPAPADPSCPACGAPLPRREGPAVVCREVAPAAGREASPWLTGAPPCA